MSAIPNAAARARAGQALRDIEAAAAQIWLGYGGADPDGAIATAIERHWRAKGGPDPYWDFLMTRGACDLCGEAYTYENLALCPNCLSAGCPKHARACACGHQRLG